jgi:serine/threonine-protein kinase
MKLASGLTLAKVLKKLREQDPEVSKKYTLDVLLDIFLKICNGIEFAHSQNISHLDLKPENIQLGEYGEVLILDWGLAIEHSTVYKEENPEKTQKVQRKEHLTQDGVIKGTPEYMSPEQALGLNSNRGPKCDIYALGAILYAILCFHPPVTGKSRDEIIQNSADGNLLPIRKQETGGRAVPQVLQFIAFKAMSRAPSQRYASARALAFDVQSYLHGFPTVAENAGVFTRFLLFLKRERLQMFLAISLFFTCFIFIVFLMAKIYYKNMELNIYESTVVSENIMDKPKNQ